MFGAVVSVLRGAQDVRGGSPQDRRAIQSAQASANTYTHQK